MSIHLENAEYITPGICDYALREWSLDPSVETFGDVQSLAGHFAIFEVTSDMIAEMSAREGDPYLSAHFEPAWYILWTDGFGFVFGHRYASEVMARRDFDSLEWRVLTEEEN